jgi:hypothetical protein
LGILTASESTEVIHGAENIVERMLQGYATCNEAMTLGKNLDPTLKGLGATHDMEYMLDSI